MFQKKKIEIANGFIRTENNVSSIVVYDTKGCKQKAINNSDALNILDLQKGVYIVIVNNINHIASYKFIIE
ncbi:MAG: T9SS type A sorting domain-containing protein [Bacteroidaceae bacterium]|nr:T9SS type A sorting domain-containing protein [Bacteroidaceae bacterium]